MRNSDFSLFLIELISLFPLFYFLFCVRLACNMHDVVLCFESLRVLI